MVLLGMIASGKDTQAKIIKAKYSMKSIESGAHWRKLLKENSPDGKWVRRTMGKGKPAPVVLMKKFLTNEIAKKPKGKDLLFLGNPRLKPEAQFLKKTLDIRGEDFLVLYITLPDKEVQHRSIKRKTGRTDDEKYIKRRIEWHKEQVRKTIKYFKNLGKLKIINGNQSVPKVTKDILKAIETFKASH